ncbi:hypothetical protein EDD33_1740 [Nocardioides aurantiacus]|uniref:Uncharacterized protein n=1 Tax=Nocardioides aurantiacus TaxID=86796 RepID=A0A3N2CTP6_9ACTN|nr:hypothetical protein EDD33_1740 [Nocardioides aurantiacus]
MLLAAAVLAVVVVALSPLVDSVMVGDREEQHDVAFGAPFPWVRQDQRDLEPPLPAKLRLASPQEHPTGTSPAVFVVDVAAAFTVFAAAGSALLVAVACGRRTRPGQIS